MNEFRYLRRHLASDLASTNASIEAALDAAETKIRELQDENRSLRDKLDHYRRGQAIG